MINPVDTPKRVLAIDVGGSFALQLARALPIDGALILMERLPERGEDARRRVAEEGFTDKVTVIIGDPARMLYKIAGPFDLIVSVVDMAESDPLSAALHKITAPDGRQTTPARLAVQHIRELNPSLNAFITIADEPTLHAQPADGPLRGLPISVKDLIDIEGLPTTVASKIRIGHIASADATIVERLRKAGAVMVGKTNLHECALGVTNDESAFGPARNPHDITRSPGGSSGGSAVAVAAGMSWASIGSDTGGSIRIPAAACGVVGLKASIGEIPTTGVFPLSASLDHVGPLAHSVRDAWTVYEVLTDTPPVPKEAMPVSQIRLGRLVGYFSEKIDPQVRKRFDEALDRLKSAGATIVDVTIRHASDTPLAYARLVLTEAFAVHRDTLASSGSKYSEGVRARLEAGRDLTPEDYEWAQKDRAILRKEVDAALVTCDALVLPTLPIPAPTIGASTVRLGSSDEEIRPLMLRMTQLFNLTGHPAVSLPCGLTAEGLPCGFQIVGRRDSTPELLSLSLACEPFVSRGARARGDDRDL